MQMVIDFLNRIIDSWSLLWSSKYFRIQFLLTVFFFALVVWYSCLCFGAWEFRKGTLISDPLLSRIPPRDLSVEIFLLIQSGLFISFFLLLQHPRELIKGFQACTLLFIFRTLSVYLVPLETPVGLIYLKDPFTELFLGSDHPVTKDLFFSGHIANMVLFFYFTQVKLWKRYLMVATPLLAGLILWQHVHYTTDVIAAPFFALAACKLSDLFNERWRYGLDRIENELLSARIS